MRRHLGLGELPDHLAEQFVILGQLEHDSSSRCPRQRLTFTLTLRKTSTVVTPAEARTDRMWTVGELAEDLGVTTRTLRFYEAEGLVSPHRVGTSRIYSPRDRARLRLILRGKRFGMSLAEIRETVDMDDGAASAE